MFTNMFQGIFQGVGAQDIQPPQFLLCLLVSLIIGVFLAFVYTYKIRYTQSFVVTLALIPAIVCLAKRNSVFVIPLSISNFHSLL